MVGILTEGSDALNYCLISNFHETLKNVLVPTLEFARLMDTN